MNPSELRALLEQLARGDIDASTAGERVLEAMTAGHADGTRPEDQPAIWLNEKIMEQYRPKQKPLYYDPSKYDTYLEQLGIKYPTVH